MRRLRHLSYAAFRNICKLPANERSPWLVAFGVRTTVAVASQRTWVAEYASSSTRSTSGESEHSTRKQYTAEEIASWRATFRFPRRYHSLAQFGYSDDELIEWRSSFDNLADSGERISYFVFKSFVEQRFSSVIPSERLARKVEHFFGKFDKDKNSFIDFGEFVTHGVLLDVDWAKEKIRQDGLEETFFKYATEDTMSEDGLHALMCDFCFITATTTDLHKLMRVADVDADGLVSLSDFVQWVESSDVPLECATLRTRDLVHLHKKSV